MDTRDDDAPITRGELRRALYEAKHEMDLDTYSENPRVSEPAMQIVTAIEKIARALDLDLL